MSALGPLSLPLGLLLLKLELLLCLEPLLFLLCLGPASGLLPLSLGLLLPTAGLSGLHPS